MTVKSIKFNDSKEEDIKILEFIESQNFSGYVKELILVDMERRNRSLELNQRTAKGGIKIIKLGSNTTPPPAAIVTL